MIERTGFTKITNNNSVAFSVPVRIYGFSFVSGGGGTINLYDGADDTAPLVISETTTTSHSLFNYLQGITFKTGCYIANPDNNLSYLTLYYEKI